LTTARPASTNSEVFSPLFRGTEWYRKGDGSHGMVHPPEEAGRGIHPACCLAFSSPPRRRARFVPNRNTNAHKKRYEQQIPFAFYFSHSFSSSNPATMSDFALAGKHVNVAMMTSGGLAPCLSSSVSLLAKYWVEAYRAGKISGLTLRMYKDGYKGVLIGDSFIVPETEWDGMEVLNFIGGSPIGNSRVKVRKITTIQK
jgi:hypothetical protein